MRKTWLSVSLRHQFAEIGFGQPFGRNRLKNAENVVSWRGSKRLNFTNILKGIWCRGTESNCRHQPFQDVGEFCNELKFLMSFCRSEHGQLNGQPATSNVPQGRLNQQPRSRLNCHCALGKRPEHVSNGVVIGVRSLSRCGVLPPCRFSTVAKCPSRLTVSKRWLRLVGQPRPFLKWCLAGC